MINLGLILALDVTKMMVTDSILNNHSELSQSYGTRINLFNYGFCLQIMGLHESKVI